MQIRHVVGIAVLIAAVSLQLYLLRYNKMFKSLVSELHQHIPDSALLSGYITGYLDAGNSYLQRIYQYFGLSNPLTDDDNTSDDDRGIPDDVIKNFRPPHMEFSVGDVIFMRNMKIGVVIGWQIDMTDLKKDPEYYLLVEGIETIIKEKQFYMIPMEGVEIQHPMLEKYFQFFDGRKYSPKKWLQDLYPKG